MFKSRSIFSGQDIELGWKRICLRKSSKNIITYFQDSQFIENPNGDLLCPNEMKKCIVSSTGNFICVSRFELCPITKLAIESKVNLQTPNRTRWKYEYEFENKVLMLDNELGLEQPSSISLFSRLTVKT